MSALLEHKEIAALIGAYIGHFAAVEAATHTAFELAVGGNGRWAEAILGHVQSVATRLDILESLLRERVGELHWAEEALLLIPPLKKANAYRNKLAHGAYSTEQGANRLLLIGNMFEKKKTFRQEEITAEEIAAEYRSLEQLLLRLMMAVGMLPRGFVKPEPR